MNNLITSHSSSLNTHEIVIIGTKSEVLNINLKINQSEKFIDELKTRQQIFITQLEGFKSLNFKIEDLQLKLMTTDNFIDKYLPFYTQAQISETLHSCLSTTHKRKLIQFEDKKFKELNNNIYIDDGNHKLEKKITGIYEILENVIKRYSKAIITEKYFKKETFASDNEEDTLNKNEIMKVSQLYIHPLINSINHSLGKLYRLQNYQS